MSEEDIWPFLPPEGVTRWLSLDQGRKTIPIAPAATVPDITTHPANA
jgi:hypothetical protein